MSVDLQEFLILAKAYCRDSQVQLRQGESWAWSWEERCIFYDPESVKTDPENVSLALLLHESGHCLITRLHELASPFFQNNDLFWLFNALEDVRVDTFMMRRYAGSRPWFRENHAKLLKELIESNLSDFDLFLVCVAASSTENLRDFCGFLPPSVRRALEAFLPAFQPILQAALPPADLAMPVDAVLNPQFLAACPGIQEKHMEESESYLIQLQWQYLESVHLARSCLERENIQPKVKNIEYLLSAPSYALVPAGKTGDKDTPETNTKPGPRSLTWGELERLCPPHEHLSASACPSSASAGDASESERPPGNGSGASGAGGKSDEQDGAGDRKQNGGATGANPSKSGPGTKDPWIQPRQNSQWNPSFPRNPFSQRNGQNGGPGIPCNLSSAEIKKRKKVYQELLQEAENFRDEKENKMRKKGIIPYEGGNGENPYYVYLAQKRHYVGLDEFILERIQLKIPELTPEEQQEWLKRIVEAPVENHFRFILENESQPEPYSLPEPEPRFSCWTFTPEAFHSRREKSWSEYFSEISEQFIKLKQVFRRFHEIRSRTTWMKGYAHGQRLDMPTCMQAEADPRIKTRIWMKKKLPEKPTIAASLLIDLSGSMSHKIENGLYGIILLAEVLSHYNIPFRVDGFRLELIPILDFFRELQDRHRETLLSQCRSTGNSNDDGKCLAQAARHLLARQEDVKLLFVISDGLPTGSKEPEKDLHEAVESIKDQLYLIGLGIGPGTESMQLYYPYCRHSLATTGIADAMTEIIAEILASPLRAQKGNARRAQPPSQAGAG